MTRRTKKPKAIHGDTIQITVGDYATNVAAGKDVHQIITRHTQENISESDLLVIHALFAELRHDIEKQLPPNTKGLASRKIIDLEKAVTAKKPDLSKIDRIKEWFLKNLPQLAGTVINVLVNPIVGKVVEAAGDLAVGELKRRLGL